MNARQAMVQAHRIASQRLVHPPTLAELLGYRVLTVEDRHRIAMALEELQEREYYHAHLSPKR
jgi:hypothetical protein